MILELLEAPFAPGARLDAFLAGRRDAGGVVAFTGLARDEGGRVSALELHCYRGFAERTIGAVVEGAVARFALLDALVLHRIGLIRPGEAIVLVAAAARHRRQAFEGADFLMDYLKSRAPFWKKSHEDGASRWIEPRPEDYQDAARWDRQETAP